MPFIRHDAVCVCPSGSPSSLQNQQRNPGKTAENLAHSDSIPHNPVKLHPSMVTPIPAVPKTMISYRKDSFHQTPFAPILPRLPQFRLNFWAALWRKSDVFWPLRWPDCVREPVMAIRNLASARRRLSGSVRMNADDVLRGCAARVGLLDRLEEVTVQGGLNSRSVQATGRVDPNPIFMP